MREQNSGRHTQKFSADCRWKFSGGSFLLNVLASQSYSGGAWVEAFEHDFSVSLATASMVSGANNAAFSLGCFLCFVFPKLVNSSHCAFACTATLALAFLISSWGEEIGLMVVTQGLCSGLACGFSFMYPLSNISRHVPVNEVGKMTGYLLAGVGVGLFLWSPMVLALHKTIGWRSSARVMAAMAGLIGLAGVELCRRAFNMPALGVEEPALAETSKAVSTATVPKGQSVSGDLQTKDSDLFAKRTGEAEKWPNTEAQWEIDSTNSNSTEGSKRSDSNIGEPSAPPCHAYPPLISTLPFWLLTAYFTFASVCTYTPWTHLSTMVRLAV